MVAEIISIGDELLIGQVVNTNQAFIAEQLNSVGILVGRMTTVGDRKPDILRSFEQAWSSYDVVLVTGGLGPTHDDITRDAICDFFKTPLVVDQQALENVRRIFARRGVEPKKINEDQAMVPSGCTVIQNRYGTAPGYFFEKEGRYFAAMPGVPFEMKSMVEDFLIPFFAKKGSDYVILHKTLKTTGIPESFLAEQIGDTNQYFPADSGITLAFLPSPLGVRLRLSARARSSDEAKRAIDEVEAKLRAKVGKYIYAIGDEELEHVIGKMLAEHKLTLSVAESCTGGLIADRITNAPGSSRYFDRALITYSNESKVEELGVPESLIRDFGAVSREVAEAMAFGVRTKSNTDIGISTTGIAGPTGGTAEKPVGLVWIGYSDKNETLALRFNFGDDRRRFKERASQAALELLRRKILKLE
ncbi:MAG TPA: competence/damage-inducible protein A [Bacteroidota bacterium]|nr:competence/damage-inducible protein A [Bacteroidota bacterium]